MLLTQKRVENMCKTYVLVFWSGLLLTIELHTHHWSWDKCGLGICVMPRLKAFNMSFVLEEWQQQKGDDMQTVVTSGFWKLHDHLVSDASKSPAWHENIWPTSQLRDFPGFSSADVPSQAQQSPTDSTQVFCNPHWTVLHLFVYRLTGLCLLPALYSVSWEERIQGLLVPTMVSWDSVPRGKPAIT